VNSFLTYVSPEKSNNTIGKRPYEEIGKAMLFGLLFDILLVARPRIPHLPAYMYYIEKESWRIDDEDDGDVVGCVGRRSDGWLELGHSSSSSKSFHLPSSSVIRVTRADYTTSRLPSARDPLHPPPLQRHDGRRLCTVTSSRGMLFPKSSSHAVRFAASPPDLRPVFHPRNS